MVYYAQGMELEVVSEAFRGPVNDVLICRDRLSASGTRYTLLAVHDRVCARSLLAVLENSEAAGESPCLLRFSQNETLLFAFLYREERKFSAFARGQAATPGLGESICVNLVMECLSAGLPWPLLYLVLSQDGVQIAKDNTVYFTLLLDLADLDPERSEKNCVSCCARLLLELLEPAAKRRRKRLKIYELIRRKSAKYVYNGFPELYQDIKVTALPAKKTSLKTKAAVFWQDRRDGLFRLLLVLCAVLALAAAAALVSNLLFGEIPLLRLFQHRFDVIGMENLHRGGP